MRLNYYEKQLLSCVFIDNIEIDDWSTYFSQNKCASIFVIDNTEKPIAYIDYNAYLEKLQTGESRLKTFSIVLNDNSYSVKHVYSFFERNSDIICIPVISKDSGIFIGAYIRENSEINSYTHISTILAKAILPAFANEVNQYLSINWRNIYINCSDDDYVEISTIIDNVIHLDPTNLDGLSDSDLIIDLKYSQKYRTVLLSDNCSAACVSLNDIVSASIIDNVNNYSKAKGFKVLYIEGPIKEKIRHCRQNWPQLYEGYSLESIFQQKDLVKGFDKKICLSDNKIISNGVHLLMADETSKSINISNGFRRTIPDVIGGNKIYIYGSCLSYGSCVNDEDTIASYLQNILQDNIETKSYSVSNCGVKNGKNILNDLLYILQTPFGKGDVVIELNSFPEVVAKEICKSSTINEFSSYFNTHYTIDCQFLDNTFHVNNAVNKILALYISEILNEKLKQKDNKIANKSCYFDDYSIGPKIDSSQLLVKGLLNQYITVLKKAKSLSNGYSKIGSVILTANPFTFGHQYLVVRTPVGEPQ